MQTNAKHLLALVLGIALAFLAPMDVAVSDKRNPKRGKQTASTARVGGVWSNMQFLRQHLGHALQIVPVAAGEAFPEAEPTIRIGDREEVTGILRADFDAAFRRMGAKDDAQVVGMAEAFATRLPAVYDPAENRIHILPENAVEAAARAGDPSLLNEGVLRLLIVRMCALAMDRQLFPEWKQKLDAAPDADALQAAGAVLQGHAQYLTERVATAAKDPAWQLQPDFDRLVTLLTTPGPNGPFQKAIDPEIKFAILKGHAFMRLLARKQGKGGIERHMKEPPTSRAPLLDPEAHFGVSSGARNGGGSAAKGKLPERVVAEFGALSEGDGWTTTSRAVEQADADALIAALEPQYSASIRAGFAGGTAWTLRNETSGVETTITLIEMKHAGVAEALVNTAMGLARKTDAEVQEGAGRDSGLPGYVAKGKTGSGSPHMAQWTYEGKYVIGLETNDPEADREAQDDALEAAAEVLAKAQKSRSNKRREKRR